MNKYFFLLPLKTARLAIDRQIDRQGPESLLIKTEKRKDEKSLALESNVTDRQRDRQTDMVDWKFERVTPDIRVYGLIGHSIAIVLPRNREQKTHIN